MYQSLSTSCFAAWLFNAFYLYENHRWGDLIASAIVFPIGILHGFYLFWPK
jgi:hypothetical protein